MRQLQAEARDLHAQLAQQSAAAGTLRSDLAAAQNQARLYLIQGMQLMQFRGGSNSNILVLTLISDARPCLTMGAMHMSIHAQGFHPQQKVVVAPHPAALLVQTNPGPFRAQNP